MYTPSVAGLALRSATTTAGTKERVLLAKWLSIKFSNA